MPVHLPKSFKHSPHHSSTQRNRLIHLILLLSSEFGIYWAESCFKPYDALIQKIALGSSFEPHSLALASHFFHTSAIEDCLHHLRSCIRPCSPVPMLLQTRRAAPVCKRHRLGICCGHAYTKASKPPLLGFLLGVSDSICHSRPMGQSSIFLRPGLKSRVCARRSLVRYDPFEKNSTPLS